MNFKEAYLAGTISFEAIDEYIAEWNERDDPQTLAQFLGLDSEEEDLWICVSDDALKEALDKQKKD